METFKITFKLATAISFVDLPTFDGLLSFCYAKETLKDKFYQKLSYDKKEKIDFSKMPIDLHVNGYFMASIMFFEKKEEFTERWRKRWDNRNDFKVNFGKRLKKIQITRSEFKSYDMPYSLSAIPEVWFYFQSNDINRVKILLEEHLVGIGKKVNYGNGIINNFNIEKAVFNFNSIFRPIPEKFVTKEMLSNSKDVQEVFCSYKPPYWDLENFDNCISIT